jgi:hydrogenase maturation protein HypF
LAAALAAWAEHAMSAMGTRVLALGGGCCANRVWSRGITDACQSGSCTRLTARALPTGDDAISYGQAWAAIESLTGGSN